MDLFLSDTRNPDESVTYTAARAYLIRTDNGPQLLMIDGMAQTLDTETGRLLTTTFDDFAYDVSDLTGSEPSDTRGAPEITTFELMSLSPALVEETGRTRAQLMLEIQNRTAQALLALSGSLIGFAALIVGGFSRFGVWRQIIIAIALVIVVKIVESVAANMVRVTPEAWYLAYLPTLVGLLITAFLLHLAAKPKKRRRIKEVAA